MILRNRSTRNLLFVFIIMALLLGIYSLTQMRVTHNDQMITALQSQVEILSVQVAQQSQLLKQDRQSGGLEKRLETGNAQTTWLQLFHKIAGETHAHILNVSFSTTSSAPISSANAGFSGASAAVSDLAMQLSLAGQRSQLLQFIQDVQMAPWITGISSVNLSLSANGASQLNFTCVVPYAA